MNNKERLSPKVDEFCVGDVWTSKDCIRTITKVTPEWIDYTLGYVDSQAPTEVFCQNHADLRRILQTTNSKLSRPQYVSPATPILASVFPAIGQVVNPVFTPARLKGEPPRGFAVGDIWCSTDGTKRTITRITERAIYYTREQSGKTTMNLAYSRSGKSRSFDARVGRGAILYRKSGAHIPEYAKVHEGWATAEIYPTFKKGQRYADPKGITREVLDIVEENGKTHILYQQSQCGKAWASVTEFCQILVDNGASLVS